jgi:hypothetical protein
MVAELYARKGDTTAAFGAIAPVESKLGAQMTESLKSYYRMLAAQNTAFEDSVAAWMKDLAEVKDTGGVDSAP